MPPYKVMLSPEPTTAAPMGRGGGHTIPMREMRSMLAQLSIWVLAATLGQAPTDTAWLKAVPADVDVAIRVRGLESTRDDLAAMLKALSPALAEQALPALDAQLAQFKERTGEGALRTPWVSLVKLNPGAGGTPPYAVLVLHDDYQAVLASISKGKAPELKHEDGGYDSFPCARRQRHLVCRQEDRLHGLRARQGPDRGRREAGREDA